MCIRDSTYTAAEAATKAAMREGFDKAQADARQALALAPDLAWAHLALANVSELGTLDFTQASDAYKRALALAPGNAEVLRLSGKFAAYMGQFDAAVAAARRAVVLDPLARASHSVLGRTLYVAHRYQEAIDALAEVLSLDPDYKDTYAYRRFAYYGAGDLQSARASCETQPDYWGNQYCLAITYDRLGRHADAEAELAKMKAVVGDTASYQYATVYAPVSYTHLPCSKLGHRRRFRERARQDTAARAIGQSTEKLVERFVALQSLYNHMVVR